MAEHESMLAKVLAKSGKARDLPACGAPPDAAAAAELLVWRRLLLGLENPPPLPATVNVARALERTLAQLRREKPPARGAGDLRDEELADEDLADTRAERRLIRLLGRRPAPAAAPAAGVEPDVLAADGNTFRNAVVPAAAKTAGRRPNKAAKRPPPSGR